MLNALNLCWDLEQAQNAVFSSSYIYCSFWHQQFQFQQIPNDLLSQVSTKVITD